VLSADLIGASLSDSDSRVKAAILKEFGKSIYGSDGRLDRKSLASLVFRNARRLSKLNSILHPAVLREIRQHFQHLPKKERTPYVAVESALLFEAGLSGEFDFVLLIDAPLSLRVERVSRRGDLTKAEIHRRAANQLPSRTKRSQADFIVSNAGSLSGLRSNLLFVDRLLSRIAQTGPF